MIAQTAWRLVEAQGKGAERGKHRAGKDGEIKGPGPFGCMALMVLRKIRDLTLGSGPGFSSFPRLFNSLSGTFLLGRPH
jgi:hypothetical protein